MMVGQRKRKKKKKKEQIAQSLLSFFFFWSQSYAANDETQVNRFISSTRAPISPSPPDY